MVAAKDARTRHQVGHHEESYAQMIEHFAEYTDVVGDHRARSHCRFARPLIHLIPGSLSYSVPLFLK